MNSLVWDSDYHGQLGVEIGSAGCTELYGFHFRPEDHSAQVRLSQPGSYFGCVMRGSVRAINQQIRQWTIYAGQWFSIPEELTLTHGDDQLDAQVVVIRQRDYGGMFAMGGPIERQGRLRYIDGCSDSLLLCPPRLGDPCLNHLHFPRGIKQTMHNHPSVRMGAVVSGSGFYVTKTQRLPLNPGSIFMIPAGVYHHFETGESTLDVFAFHPDSDWGPEDEIHPMINRTWVDGKKIANKVPDATRLF